MKTIGFKWTSERDEGGLCYQEESGKAFAMQQSCFEDMLRHATSKMLSAKCPTKCNLEVNTDKITYTSYSGTYTYEIKPIEVPDEETERMEAVRNWITRKDGYDGGIMNLTQAYMKCNDADAWDSVVEYWESNVPACPSEGPEDLDDLVLKMHLQIQEVADETNRRILRYISENANAAKKIAVVYSVFGRRQLYLYDLDDWNDCQHYFDEEQSIVAAYVQKCNKEAEEPVFYRETPVKDVTRMVLDAEKRLEQRQMETT